MTTSEEHPDHRLSSTELKRLHRDWRRRTTRPLGLILEDLASPFNVGSILRTAAAFGVTHVWCTERVPDFHASNVQKAAMGSQRFFHLARTPDIGVALEHAAIEQFLCVGLELSSAATPLFTPPCPPTTPVAFVIGNEDRGLSKTALGLLENKCFIPQVGKIGSLNVATATGIAFYELRRQEWCDD